MISWYRSKELKHCIDSNVLMHGDFILGRRELTLLHRGLDYAVFLPVCALPQIPALLAPFG